jgi:hypothetical protein
MSDAKQTITINDRFTAAAAAAKVGVKWHTGPGKPPKNALYARLTELGFEVKGTYLPKPKPKLPAVPAGKREYEITRTVADKPETIRVTIGELRAILHAESKAGSLGDSRIRDAVAKLREEKRLFIGWEDADIAKASITPVVPVQEADADVLAALDAALAPVEPAKPAAKAANTPRKPRNSRAKGADTTPAVSAPEKATQAVK